MWEPVELPGNPVDQVKKASPGWTVYQAREDQMDPKVSPGPRAPKARKANRVHQVIRAAPGGRVARVPRVNPVNPVHRVKRAPRGTRAPRVIRATAMSLGCPHTRDLNQKSVRLARPETRVPKASPDPLERPVLIALRRVNRVPRVPKAKKVILARLEKLAPRVQRVPRVNGVPRVRWVPLDHRETPA